MTRSTAAGHTAPSLATATLPSAGNVLDLSLPNGMRALLKPNFASPAVVVTATLWGGALCEPEGQEGLAGFTAALLERGTLRHGFRELSAELESIGADVDIGAGRHTFGLNVKCLAEDLSRVLMLLAEMLAEPAFAAEQVELVRSQLLTALRQRQDDPNQRASMAFRVLAYGQDHPYARDADGTPESISGVTAEDIAAFWAQARPTDGIVTLVGAVEPEDGAALLARTLGAWQPAGPGFPRVAVAAPERSAVRRRTDIAMPGKTQAALLIGHASIPRQHPDWLAASLANQILGVFGLMGRLGDVVRDAKGLAYTASSRLSGGLGPGPWYASAGVNPAHVEEAIEAILGEMRRLQDEPVTEEELADVQAYVTGSLPLRLETNEGTAAAISDMVIYELGLDYLEHFSGRVSALNRADLQHAAQMHLHPDGAAIAVAGPLYNPATEPAGAGQEA